MPLHPFSWKPFIHDSRLNAGKWQHVEIHRRLKVACRSINRLPRFIVETVTETQVPVTVSAVYSIHLGENWMPRIEGAKLLVLPGFKIQRLHRATHRTCAQNDVDIEDSLPVVHFIADCFIRVLPMSQWRTINDSPVQRPLIYRRTLSWPASLLAAALLRGCWVLITRADAHSRSPT